MVQKRGKLRKLLKRKKGGNVQKNGSYRKRNDLLLVENGFWKVESEACGKELQDYPKYKRCGDGRSKFTSQTSDNVDR